MSRTSSRRRNLATTRKSSTESDHYNTGWNLLSYSDTGTNFVFKSIRNFDGSVKSSSTSRSGSVYYDSGDIGLLGGYWSGGGISMSFKGIIHTLFVINSAVSDTALQTTYNIGGTS